jgi:hypothetical protein
MSAPMQDGAAERVVAADAAGRLRPSESRRGGSSFRAMPGLSFRFGGKRRR